MSEKLLYSEKIKLSPSQFDLNDNLLPSAIFQIFQDVASVHGEMIGVGFEAMLNKGLYWVTVRTKYDVYVQPKPYQQVVVTTWPHQKGRVDFDRDYLVEDLFGNTLIKGTSKWCVISTSTRKLVLPSAVEYPAGAEFESKVNYDFKFEKTPTVTAKQTPDFVHKVSLSEIDHNKHLNNVHYAQYVFDSLKNEHLTHMQINFIAECKLGDVVDVYFEKVGEDYLVSGYVDGQLKFSASAK